MTIKRRTFLLGSVSGLTLLAVSACTGPTTPKPTPTVPPVDSALPKPTAFHRTAWASDPFSRGAFSFQPVDSTREQRAALAAPVAGRLFFAGEHTSESDPATVQGARASGQRAALEIFDVAAEGERIAVIGAGIAGATAARTLANAGYSVVVVEGRERAGGRIHSLGGDDWPIDIELGAAWVYDAATNPVFAALEGLGIATSEFDFSTERRLPSGVPVEPSPVAPDAVAAALAWAAVQPTDLSIADALVDSGAADLDANPVAPGVSPLDRLENYLVADLVIDSGADAAELSAWFTPDPSRSTVDDRLVTGDFGALVDTALEGLNILPSSAVSSISYGERGVSLRLARGESLSADRVVITVPLGVLKANAIEFDPPLPFAQRGAIAALGMGQQDKIVLRFDAPFWSTEATVWSVIGGDTDFPLWYNLLPLTGEPILVGVMGGEAALRLSEFGDSELLEAALASLEPFRSEESVGEPGDEPAAEDGAG